VHQGAAPNEGKKYLGDHAKNVHQGAAPNEGKKYLGDNAKNVYQGAARNDGNKYRGYFVFPKKYICALWFNFFGTAFQRKLWTLH